MLFVVDADVDPVSFAASPTDYMPGPFNEFKQYLVESTFLFLNAISYVKIAL